ncbi:MAG: Rieske (2Fe-2S) protein [Gammaproteobacteria bacterium]
MPTHRRSFVLRWKRTGHQAVRHHQKRTKLKRCGTYLTLCQVGELPDGEARGFDPFGHGRDALFLVRRGKTIKAYRNRCPHQGASLPWQRNAYLNADGTRIVCSAHGAEFDLDNGMCVRGAALGHSLETVEISVTSGGAVMAQLNPPP